MEIVNSNNTGFVSPCYIKMGECFMYRGEIWMRAKPAGFICNSRVMADVVNKGDCFAVNLRTGDFTAWRRDAQVSPIKVMIDPRG